MSKLKQIYQGLVDGKAIVGFDSENNQVALQLDQEGHLHYLRYYLEETDRDSPDPEGWYDITCHEDPYPFIIKAIDESNEAPFYDMDVSITEPLRALTVAKSVRYLMSFKQLLEHLLANKVVILTTEDPGFLTFELGEEDHIKIVFFHYEEDEDGSELDYHDIEWWIDIGDQFCEEDQSVHVVDRTQGSFEAVINCIKAIPAAEL